MQKQKQNCNNIPDLAVYEHGKEVMSRIANVIARVENGETETATCAAERIGHIWFRRFLRYEFSPQEPAKIVKEQDWIGWEEELLEKICCTKVDVPDGFEKRLLKLLETEFSPQERTVLMMRYRDGATLAAAGDALGVCRERARQIEARTLHRLRRPDRRNYLLYGEEYRAALAKVRNARAEYDKAWMRAMDRISGSAGEGRAQTILNLEQELATLKKEAERLDALFPESKNDPFRQMPIEALEFSTRTYNALRNKAGVRTLGALMRLDRSVVRVIPGVGDKVMEEIGGKLAGLGIQW